MILGGIWVVIMLGFGIWIAVEKQIAYCKANDCRSVEQRIKEEPDTNKARELCLKEYDNRLPDAVPEKCKILLKL